MHNLLKLLVAASPLLGPVYLGQFSFRVEDLGPCPGFPGRRLVKQLTLKEGGEVQLEERIRVFDCDHQTVSGPDAVGQVEPDEVEQKLLQLVCAGQ